MHEFRGFRSRYWQLIYSTVCAHAALLMFTFNAPLGFGADQMPTALPMPDGTPILAGGALPGCAGIDVHACVNLAIDAMGGSSRLAAIHAAHYDLIGHRQEEEQSPRQVPFLSEYSRETRLVDYKINAVDRMREVTFPSVRPDPNVVKSHVVATPTEAVLITSSGQTPAGRREVEQAEDILAYEPSFLLRAASTAPDLRYETPEWLRATPHVVLTFTYHERPIRLVLNASNHLLDAIERMRSFDDFWFVWGDVQQRVYLDGWQDIDGVIFPASRVDLRNGTEFASEQYLAVEFNERAQASTFRIDTAAAIQSRASSGWNRVFPAKAAKMIAPGVWLFLGAWNVTVIEQDDGLLLIEAPISPLYTEGAIDAASHLVPGKKVKAVLSTTDSWPHVAGLREVVAQDIPVYVLGRNRPLFDRLITAPHTLKPDDLVRHPHSPRWREVSQVITLASHHNSVEIIPIDGPSTERQYMVYLPKAGLLYASDTLALNADNTLYDPELMREVADAVKRAHFFPRIVYAMHQSPMVWRKVVSMLPR